MNHRHLIRGSLSALFLSAAMVGAAQAGASGLQANAIGIDSSVVIKGMDNPDRIPGRYIVVLNDNVVGGHAIAATAREVARQSGFRVGTTYGTAVRGFTLSADDSLMGQGQGAEERALAMLANDPRIAYIEADRHVQLMNSQSPATWGLDRIDQRDLPLNDTYTYDNTGSGVNAYILDTGIRASHNEFGGRVQSGFTAINDGRGTGDCNGHGTHVAGTVGGQVYGVAKNATLWAVRVLDCNGSGTLSGVIDGVDWVAANAQAPAVANMSLGGGASSSLDDAVNGAANAGVTMVVAAGNENQNACNVSPARASQAFTVGSTTSNDSRSNFSNFGSCVDIFAPGSSITAAWHTSNSATNTISGTSMAAPHVAGVAALYLAENPGASRSQVENAILNGATQGRLSSIGSGSPNLLLYSLITSGDGGGDDGGGDDGGDDGGDTGGELQNGVAVNNLSASTGQELHFTMSVPSNASNLSFQISGGTGDADLYVRFGAPPTTSDWDCRPYRWGNEETCEFSNPQAGTWYVMVRAYESFSGVSLVGNHDGSGDDGGSEPAACPAGYEEFNGALSGGRGTSTYEPNGTYYYATAGVHNGILISPNDAIFDLYLMRWNGRSWSDVASSLPNSGTEAAEISYSGNSGYYVWRLEIWTGSGDYTFCMDTP
ncbi:S8 family peptidase [Natronospira bacteriovora]|uniref:S8 family peptidase n=1 Tax=Natronospira bacteriovora TaxID=3069753 RepID=A0ABU0W887_9GAMM|nr:S8 family peptidase [Natronospira sp. AB-CW4]MDQ2070256.1 S8 family peptidase [Natronospira sp. AB-CW4]